MEARAAGGQWRAHSPLSTLLPRAAVSEPSEGLRHCSGRMNKSWRRAVRDTGRLLVTRDEDPAQKLPLSVPAATARAKNASAVLTEKAGPSCDVVPEPFVTQRLGRVSGVRHSLG